LHHPNLRFQLFDADFESIVNHIQQRHGCVVCALDRIPTVNRTAYATLGLKEETRRNSSNVFGSCSLMRLGTLI
jgi:hypothetical protein